MKVCSFYLFKVWRKQDEILLQPYLDVKKKKRFTCYSSIEISIDLQKAIAFCYVLIGFVYSQH